jgi:hypothetical protein
MKKLRNLDRTRSLRWEAVRDGTVEIGDHTLTVHPNGYPAEGNLLVALLTGGTWGKDIVALEVAKEDSERVAVELAFAGATVEICYGSYRKTFGVRPVEVFGEPREVLFTSDFAPDNWDAWPTDYLGARYGRPEFDLNHSVRRASDSWDKLRDEKAELAVKMSDLEDAMSELKNPTTTEALAG